MRAVYGLYEAWLTPTFFVERGKLYDADDPALEEVLERHPDAFTDNAARITGVVEQATAAPGEKRNVRRG